MNALNFPRPRNDDIADAPACAMLADIKLGDAIEAMACWMEAYFAGPASRRDPTQRQRVAAAMVAVAHARELIGAQMVERRP